MVKVINNLDKKAYIEGKGNGFLEAIDEREEHLIERLSKRVEIDFYEVLVLLICLVPVVIGFFKNDHVYIIGGSVATFLTVVAIVWRQFYLKKRHKKGLVKVREDKDRLIEFLKDWENYDLVPLSSMLQEFEGEYRDKTEFMKANVMMRLIMNMAGVLTDVPVDEMTIIDGVCERIRCYFDLGTKRTSIDISSEDCYLEIEETSEVNEKTIILDNQYIRCSIPLQSRRGISGE